VEVISIGYRRKIKLQTESLPSSFKKPIVPVELKGSTGQIVRLVFRGMLLYRTQNTRKHVPYRIRGIYPLS